MTFQSMVCSHLVQAPCCLRLTVLLDLPSSTAALTSSWTSLRLSFPLTLSYWGVGKVPRPALLLLELLLQGLQGQLEIGVISVEVDAAKAPGQSQPPPEEAADFPLQALYDGDGDFVDQQWPEYPWQDPMLVVNLPGSPDWSTALNQLSRS